jgi:FKBP-type peptidyl-prolyl cis-trans isomerase
MKKYTMSLALVTLLGVGAICFNANANPGFVVPLTDKSEPLISTDVQVGNGAEAVAGKKISVQYTGWLYDANAKGYKGKKIDSSRDRNQPYSFVLGANKVIEGWDQGLVGMKTGGQRTLIVPGHLGYGRHGAGDKVPPDAKLVFEIELLEVN